MENRKELRRKKILARNSYSETERQELSCQIVEHILTSPEFQPAKNIMIYKGIRGEVRLEALEEACSAQEKQLLYPLCISDSEMIALLPADETAWAPGYCGILEPILERSVEILPEEIDMVICPCTVFDEQGGRMGMGAGFYDRFLPKCTKAIVAAVAFECQKAEEIPLEDWDVRMDLIYTEKTTYRG